MRSITCALLATVTLGLAACGSSPEAEVRDTVTAAYTAAKDKDYKEFCGYLDAKSTKQLKALGGCEKLVSAGGDSGLDKTLDIKKVTVDGDKATVTTKNQQEPFTLVREDGNWKLTVE